MSIMLADRHMTHELDSTCMWLSTTELDLGVGLHNYLHMMAKFQFGREKMAHSVTSPRITSARMEKTERGICVFATEALTFHL